MFYIYIM